MTVDAQEVNDSPALLSSLRRSSPSINAQRTPRAAIHIPLLILSVMDLCDLSLRGGRGVRRWNDADPGWRSWLSRGVRFGVGYTAVTVALDAWATSHSDPIPSRAASKLASRSCRCAPAILAFNWMRSLGCLRPRLFHPSLPIVLAPLSAVLAL